MLSVIFAAFPPLIALIVKGEVAFRTPLEIQKNQYQGRMDFAGILCRYLSTRKRLAN